MRSKVKSVIKAANILECFTANEPTLSLSEISQKVNMDPSTVRRILLSLLEVNYVKQDSQTRKYSLDVGMVRLGTLAIRSNDLRSIAYSYMKELADICHENVYLAIKSANQSLYIEIVEAKQDIALTGTVGSARPLHSTGTGKVFLAYLQEEELNEIIDNELQHIPDLSIPKLLKELENIRLNGITVTLSEYNPEVFAIAAPIFNNKNQVVAALAVSGPKYRLNEEKINEFKKHVIEKSSEISSINYN